MSWVPWWLNPWGEMARLREVNEILLGRLELQRKQVGNFQASVETITTLKNELAWMRRELAATEAQSSRLRGQLSAAVTDAKISGSALATDMPEFIMTGIPRGAGKRIQVSRHVEVTAFTMTEPGEGEPRFKIGAILRRLLVIDKPTYAECLAHLAVIWGNQDREAQPRGEGILRAAPLQLPVTEHGPVIQAKGLVELPRRPDAPDHL